MLSSDPSMVRGSTHEIGTDGSVSQPGIGGRVVAQTISPQRIAPVFPSGHSMIRPDIVTRSPSFQESVWPQPLVGRAFGVGDGNGIGPHPGLARGSIVADGITVGV